MTPDLRGAGWLHVRTSTWLQSTARMPPGQLDAVAPGRATITEAGPAHRLDYTYDTMTGVLVVLRRVDRSPLAEVVYDLRLVTGP